MEKNINSHKDLQIWIRSIALVSEIYKVTKKFPDDEKYGLSIQIRRAAVSIPSNIAEGSARKSNKELANFLNISMGSLSELDTQLIISKNLNYLSDIDNYLDEIKSLMLMIHAIIKKIT